MNMKRAVPYKNIYSNDTTNISTCISPYHKTRGVRFDKDVIRATVAEVAGQVDAHFIQLAHGQVPWYKSRIYPMDEHLRWWKEYFEVTDEQIASLKELCGYVRDGGDILADFTSACRDYGQAPFVSIRLNDVHHIENYNVKGHTKGIHSISKFLVDNLDLLMGDDVSVWENRALNWADPRPAERMLALITEQCENYDIDGFELDYLRIDNFFKQNETTSEERCGIMRKFISEVRTVLDRTARDGRYRYLSVRVPSDLGVWDELGLSPDVLISSGVDIANVSSHFYADQWVDRERIVNLLPGIAVYFEVCHCTHRGINLAAASSKYDNFTYRRVTPSEIYTTADLTYSAGGRGLSYFNFAYYREHGTPPEMRGPFNEPPFYAIGNARDEMFVAEAPKHFYIARGWARNSQLHRRFAVGEEHSLVIYAIAPKDDFADRFRLRVTADGPLGDAVIRVSVNGVSADPCDDISEPYDEDNAYPPLHATEHDTKAFLFPSDAVRDGENIIRFNISSNEKEDFGFYYVDMFPDPKRR